MAKKIILCVGIFSFISMLAYAEENFPFIGEITSDKVNIRAGQNINFERLVQLNKGEKIIVVAKSFDWYKIKLPDAASCYVNTKFIRQRLDGYAEVAGNRVNVRAGAGEKFSVIGQLSKGTKLKIKNQSQDWYQIEPMEGLYGWVSNKFVNFKSREIPPAKVIVEPSRSVYKPSETLPEPEVKKEPEVFSVTGRIEDLGRIVRSKFIRYKIITRDNKIYYLEDNQNLLDNFVYYTVKIKGDLKEKPEGFLPGTVIVVSKVIPIQ